MTHLKWRQLKRKVKLKRKVTVGKVRNPPLK